MDIHSIIETEELLLDGSLHVPESLELPEESTIDCTASNSMIDSSDKKELLCLEAPKPTLSEGNLNLKSIKQTLASKPCTQKRQASFSHESINLKSIKETLTEAKELSVSEPHTSKIQGRIHEPKNSTIQRVESTESASSSSPSLLQEAVECLAQSNLIFLLANLRLLSATGRLHTKFETINIDSDFVGKHCAANLTGEAVLDSHGSSAWRGISPAQTMAVLLIELRRELNARKNGLDNLPKASFFLPEKPEETLENKEDSLLSTMVDPNGRRATTNNMDKALTASIAMVGRDLKTCAPEIRGQDLMGKMLSFIVQKTSSKRNLISSRDLDICKKEEEKIDSRVNITYNSYEEDNKIKTGDNATVSRRIGSSSDPGEPKIIIRPQFLASFRTNPVLGSNGPSMVERRMSILKEVAEMIPLTEETKHRQQLENFVSDFFGVEVTSKDILSFNRNLTEAELLDVLEKAVQSRKYERLQFMADFFKEGTVSRAVMQSRSKVVWLNDWYPLKDLTYAISIDEGKKRVTVIFRGAITSSDWGATNDRTFQKTPNPVKEDFHGKHKCIKLHRGFFLYLFRRRKDTKTCKYDEIANVVERYGRAIGEDYTVLVTGHSLGGALSTVFAFYASTEERFTKNGPLKCFTFGAPMVGGYAFAGSFRYQERNQKLMLARFYNARDVVAHLPFNFKYSSRGALYYHTGIGVRLAHTACSCIDTRKSCISYLKEEESWLNSYGRALGSNFILHMPFPWRIRIVHDLDLHLKRMLLHQEKGKYWELELTFEELYASEVLGSK